MHDLCACMHELCACKHAQPAVPPPKKITLSVSSSMTGTPMERQGMAVCSLHRGNGEVRTSAPARWVWAGGREVRGGGHSTVVQHVGRVAGAGDRNTMRARMCMRDRRARKRAGEQGSAPPPHPHLTSPQEASDWPQAHTHMCVL